MGIFAKPTTLKFDSWLYSNIVTKPLRLVIIYRIQKSTNTNCDSIINIV